MKLLKKLSLCMAAVCAAAMLPLPCHAEEAYSYTILEDGTISLYCEDKSIIHAEIPSELDGYTVTELAEGCFSDCTALETVTIPDTIISMQSYVFQNCVLLEEVTIPASVTAIDDFVFEGCVSLTDIHVEEENASYYDTDGILFYKGLSVTLMRYPAAKEWSSYSVPWGCSTLSPWSFTDCRYLETIYLPDVQAIGADAFMGAAKLQSIELPDRLSELIGATFANCRELRTVKLPEKLKIIGDRCFYGCISLEDINLPDTLESIGEMAFFGCVEITDMKIPASVKTIGQYGVGYSVDSAGEPVQISGMKLETTFGSKGHKYARENNIAYQAVVPTALMILILVGFVMLAMLGIGIYSEMHKKKLAKLAEEERLRQQRIEERKARKKKRK